MSRWAAPPSLNAIRIDHHRADPRAVLVKERNIGKPCQSLLDAQNSTPSRNPRANPVAVALTGNSVIEVHGLKPVSVGLAAERSR